MLWCRADECRGYPVVRRVLVAAGMSFRSIYGNLILRNRKKKKKLVNKLKTTSQWLCHWYYSVCGKWFKHAVNSFNIFRFLFASFLFKQDDVRCGRNGIESEQLVTEKRQNQTVRWTKVNVKYDYVNCEDCERSKDGFVFMDFEAYIRMNTEKSNPRILRNHLNNDGRRLILTDALTCFSPCQKLCSYPKFFYYTSDCANLWSFPLHRRPKIIAFSMEFIIALSLEIIFFDTFFFPWKLVFLFLFFFPFLFLCRRSENPTTTPRHNKLTRK